MLKKLTPAQIKVLVPAIASFVAALGHAYWPAMAPYIDGLAAAVTTAVLVRRPGDISITTHPDDIR